MRLRPLGAVLLAALPVLAVAVPVAASGLQAPAQLRHAASLRADSAATATIQSFAFHPMTVTVNPGSTVTWTNLDLAPHTVTSDTGLFDSGAISQNGTYPHTFNTPGTYEYHCMIHPFMAHAFVVVPAPTLSRSRVSGGFKDTLTITGTNFFSNETVNVYFDVTSTTPLSSAVSNGAGTVVETFLVPQAISGTHTIIAVGQTGHLVAKTGFLIRPKTFLKHYQGSAGSTNQITGAGFGPHETVVGHWNSPSGQVLGTTTTSSIGTFGGTGGITGITFTVPLSPTGSYRVYGVGQSSGGVAFSTFTLR